MNETAQGQTIRKKIMNGYLVVISIICVLVVGSTICLTIVEQGYKEIITYSEQQNTAQSVITAHYKWLEGLNTSILNDEPFTGSLDPTSCALGKWLQNSSPEEMNDPIMSTALKEITTPHKEIHEAASGLVELSKSDRERAYMGYMDEIKPKVVTISDGLTKIINRYQEISDQKTQYMELVVVLSFALCILVGLAAVFVALFFARRVSNKIAKPVGMVTEWSEALATGIENMKWDHAGAGSGILEIERMTRAFQNMVGGIQQNVNVIQRIAAGDMTVYVDIKSEGDVLGRNLYRLVQSNDIMFANLLKVAEAVANTSQSIAEDSQYQASQTASQAMAVESLSETVSQANSLAESNAKRARDAANVSEEIKQSVQAGNEKMARLMQSVEEIQSASEAISSVMSAIDSIAFQTDILALNAAVEAARAGEAGKGFSVVAQEVRDLALKSAEAAQRSSSLIQDTIQKTAEGNRISKETAAMFDHIVGGTNQITEIVEEISKASDSQQQHIDSIHDEINRITEAVNSNASSSQATVASTQEMTRNAALIRQEMKRFNLRERVEGQPYIPLEKQNDPEFIRIASENYQRALHSHPHDK